MYEATNADAAEAAAGWDGLRFEVYLTPDDDLVIVGSSVWDTGGDAVEFESAFSEVLAEVMDAKLYLLSRSETSVDVIIGPAEPATSESIFMALRPNR